MPSHYEAVRIQNFPFRFLNWLVNNRFFFPSSVRQKNECLDPCRHKRSERFCNGASSYVQRSCSGAAILQYLFLSKPTYFKKAQLCEN